MKGYLLDTNVVSELRKQKPHGAVLGWIQSLRNEEAFISAITLGELQAGVELTRTQDPTKAQEIERWVDRLAGVYQVLPMDARCFREWARLMHKKSDRLIEDAMIAATARLHDLVIATRNERNFIGFDVQIYNPFKS
jgi:predicted nucleic acid-binding protein